MAVAPGIATFVAGAVYEHGGVSPQECVTPVITVRAAAAPRGPIALAIEWRGLRAQVSAAGSPDGARVDLRHKAGDPGSSLLPEPVPVSPDGAARFLVADDDAIDTPAFLVVLDGEGRVVAQDTVIIGGKS
jgi:hypothetical protein